MLYRVRSNRLTSRFMGTRRKSRSGDTGAAFTSLGTGTPFLRSSVLHTPSSVLGLKPWKQEYISQSPHWEQNMLFT